MWDYYPQSRHGHCITKYPRGYPAVREEGDSAESCREGERPVLRVPVHETSPAGRTLHRARMRVAHVQRHFSLRGQFGDYAAWFARKSYENLATQPGPEDTAIAPSERATRRW